MSLLLETIRIEAGIPANLAYHEARISHSQMVLDGHRQLPKLTELFEEDPPPSDGLIKARVVYNKDLFKIEYLSYKKVSIQTLRMIHLSALYYPHKFANRQRLKTIKDELQSNEEAILCIGNRLTDTTYTSLAFGNEKGWFTPKFPLLKGTQREFLIEKGIIKERDLGCEDITNFTRVRLFNAMIPWEEAIEIPTSKIINEEN